MEIDLSWFREHVVSIGISECLLGRPVRYDGGDKRHDWLVDVLGPHVRWVPVCPEVEAGMGVPRPPIDFVRVGGAVRLMASGRDITEPMQRLAETRAEALAAEGLAGYVFKTRSPSCGVTGVRVFDSPGAQSFERSGQGLFAAALMARYPGLPVVEEHELDTPEARARFVTRVRIYDEARRRGRV